MAAILMSRETTTTAKRTGLSINMVIAENKIVNTEEMNWGSPSCMAADTFSRSLVTRLMTSPVLWVSK